jgi:hypothetical protein
VRRNTCLLYSVVQVIVNPTTTRSQPWRPSNISKDKCEYKLHILWKLEFLNLMATNWSGRIKKCGCNDNTLYSKQVLRLTILSVYIKYDTTLCDKVCQWLAAGRWFSHGTLVSSTNKTGLHDITEILLKVALKTITLIPSRYSSNIVWSKRHWQTLSHNVVSSTSRHERDSNSQL